MTSTLHRTLSQLLLAFPLGLCCHNLLAQTLYQVEIIAFERKGAARAASTSSNDTNLQYPANLYRLTSGEAATGDFFAVLPASRRNLNSQAAALGNSKPMRVLFHQAWQQPVDDGTPAIAIQGGSTFGEHKELEGSVRIGQGKTLEITTNLWLSQFVPAMGNGQTSPQSLNLPPLPGEPANSDANAPASFIPTTVIQVSRTHRLKAGEIHYLDHPIVGLLVRVQSPDMATTP